MATDQVTKSAYYDDEIDLMEYLVLIWRYRIFLVVFVIISLFSCFIFHRVATPRYEVRTSFFVVMDNGPTGSGSALMGYAQLLGMGGMNQDMSGYIISLIESKNMLLRIADAFKEDFSGLEPQEIIDKLRLKKRMRIKMEKNGLFIMRYENSSAAQAFAVVDLYLKNLIIMNKSLQLSAQNNFITVLDAPELPEQPSWPKKKINYVLTFIGSMFLGVFLIFIIETIRNYQPKKG